MAKYINQKNITFFILSLLIMHSNASDDIGLDCESEPDVFNGTLPAPPASSLKMMRSNMNDELKEMRPDNWNVRAIYIDNGGLYVFDEKGNALIAESEDTNGGYLVEMYVKKSNQPLWSGNSKVYYWYHPDSNEHDNSLLLANDRAFVLSQNKLCTANRIANTYSFYVTNQKELYLNGNCTDAKKITINDHMFLTYPDLVEKGNYPYYWSVQYFNEPISLIYDIDGNCIYYCNKPL